MQMFAETSYAESTDLARLIDHVLTR